MLGRLADQIRGGLAVEPVRNTQLVQLSFRAASPEFAAKAANAFAEAYIDMGVEDRFATAGKASTFLSSQIETLKQEIQDKETQLQAFSRRSDIVSMDPAANVTLKRLEALNASTSRPRRRASSARRSYHETLNGPAEIDGRQPVERRGERPARRQLLKLERDYETKLKTYKPDFPDMVALKAEIEKARQHLDEVDRRAGGQGAAATPTPPTRRRCARSRRSRTSSTRSSSEAIDQNSAAVEYTNLKVEIQTRRDLLDELMRKQSETEVAVRLQDTRQSNIRIIDKALVPGGPFQPSLRKDVSYGLLLGLLLRHRLRRADRVPRPHGQVARGGRARLGLPTLAVIQDLAESGKAYGYSATPTATATARPRRSSPGAPEPDGRRRLARQEEGGRRPAPRDADRAGAPRAPAHADLRGLPLAAHRAAPLLAPASSRRWPSPRRWPARARPRPPSNLAVVLAQLGRQVLIVDCDLRKPRLHQVFRVSNRFGLVNQLTAHRRAGVGLPADRGAEPLGHPLGTDPAEPVGAALLGPHARLAAARCARGSTSSSSTRRRPWRSPTPPSSALLVGRRGADPAQPAR